MVNAGGKKNTQYWNYFLSHRILYVTRTIELRFLNTLSVFILYYVAHTNGYNNIDYLLNYIFEHNLTILRRKIFYEFDLTVIRSNTHIRVTKARPRASRSTIGARLTAVQACSNPVSASDVIYLTHSRAPDRELRDTNTFLGALSRAIADLLAR